MGIIFTVLKRVITTKKDSNSCRAITLSSSVFKLFESVLMVHINGTRPLPMHSLQEGFQRGIGCMMSSLALNECIQFARELDRNLYACFLDCKQAFDRVWHDGLFYKLSHYLKAPVLSCILGMYTDVCSSL